MKTLIARYKFKVLLMIVILGLGLVVLFTLPHHIASERLLHRIQVVKPGMNIELVMDQLGRKITETSDVQEMEYWNRGESAITDSSFFHDKKLFRFYTTPPCRVLEVYTDTNNIVIFVRWQTM